MPRPQIPRSVPVIANRSNRSFLSAGLVGVYKDAVAAAGGTLSDREVTALLDHLPDLVDVLPKIRAMWLPLGDFNAMPVLLKPLAGGASAMTLTAAAGPVAWAATDYDRVIGVKPSAGKRITTDHNPRTIFGNSPAAEYGIAVFSGSTGWTGILGGVLAGADFYVGYGQAGGVLSWETIANTTATGGCGRGLQAVQSKGGVTQRWRGGWNANNVAQSSPAAPPNSVVTLFSGNNGFFSSNGSTILNGYLLFDPLTADELRLVNQFYLNMLEDLGRDGYQKVHHSDGDSLVLGVQVTATERWTTQFATRFGFVDDNNGQNGGTIIERGNSADFIRVANQEKGFVGRMPASWSLAYGINDLSAITPRVFDPSEVVAAYDTVLANALATGVDMRRGMICSQVWYDSAAYAAQYPTSAWTYQRAVAQADGLRALAEKYGCQFMDFLRAGSMVGVAGVTRPDRLHMEVLGHTLCANDAIALKKQSLL